MLTSTAVFNLVTLVFPILPRIFANGEPGVKPIVFTRGLQGEDGENMFTRVVSHSWELLKGGNESRLQKLWKTQLKRANLHINTVGFETIVKGLHDVLFKSDLSPAQLMGIPEFLDDIQDICDQLESAFEGVPEAQAIHLTTVIPLSAHLCLSANQASEDFWQDKAFSPEVRSLLIRKRNVMSRWARWYINKAEEIRQEWRQWKWSQLTYEISKDGRNTLISNRKNISTMLVVVTVKDRASGFEKDYPILGRSEEEIEDAAKGIVKGWYDRAANAVDNVFADVIPTKNEDPLNKTYGFVDHHGINTNQASLAGGNGGDSALPYQVAGGVLACFLIVGAALSCQVNLGGGPIAGGAPPKMNADDGENTLDMISSIKSDTLFRGKTKHFPRKKKGKGAALALKTAKGKVSKIQPVQKDKAPKAPKFPEDRTMDAVTSIKTDTAFRGKVKKVKKDGPAQTPSKAAVSAPKQALAPKQSNPALGLKQSKQALAVKSKVPVKKVTFAKTKSKLPLAKAKTKSKVAKIQPKAKKAAKAAAKKLAKAAKMKSKAGKTGKK